jgi:hypothetical protein
LASLEPVDICFLFKVLDIIGEKPIDYRDLIRKIPSRYLLISFSTVTLSGKKMRYPKREWLENICKHEGYMCRIFKSENEIFYLIDKEA